MKNVISGTAYASYALKFPDRVKVIGVAEPVQIRYEDTLRLRESFTKVSEILVGCLDVFMYNIPEENDVTDWKEFASRSKFADAVVITTLDQFHVEPAIAFANLKYHILLEKPMAVKLDECKRIIEAVKVNEILFGIGMSIGCCYGSFPQSHVLRYNPLNLRIKSILDSGKLGNVINIQHLEPVGWWHFAHSVGITTIAFAFQFVRGNWKDENTSSFSLMTKKVSSFGSLHHFNKANKPKEAGNAINCLSCPHAAQCPYDAKKIYIDDFKNGNRGWPINVVTNVLGESGGETCCHFLFYFYFRVRVVNCWVSTILRNFSFLFLLYSLVDIENLTDALKIGPYGQCVYESDNNVMDNQVNAENLYIMMPVVNLQFANGATASFTMIATTEAQCARKTRIYGSLGQLDCDHETNEISWFDFLSKNRTVIHPYNEAIQNGEDFHLSGHGGGDSGLMGTFVNTVAAAKSGAPISGSIMRLPTPTETLMSHAYVFAAEEARQKNKVVDVKEFLAQP
ncbi:hypothetical protein BC938DRAFT_474773 [Jimgerdemannia flammicorona]|uniref:Gfo/Idh/MocA-like oxidoreductase N-terminal domain-containing protein n=1 Tax=Jimgerdemannia flammicorona TaxID=994334 RepID=A0A433QS71_9FUNG|nr:hypothetical protein BC938DRAFT_474773 [Jimgerdemannia flammicorona]